MVLKTRIVRNKNSHPPVSPFKKYVTFIDLYNNPEPEYRRSKTIFRVTH